MTLFTYYEVDAISYLLLLTVRTAQSRTRIRFRVNQTQFGYLGPCHIPLFFFVMNIADSPILSIDSSNSSSAVVQVSYTSYKDFLRLTSRERQMLNFVSLYSILKLSNFRDYPSFSSGICWYFCVGLGVIVMIGCYVYLREKMAPLDFEP